MELGYQKDAVRDAKSKLEEYGGVFLSDVVGLGKTYIAAMLAQQLMVETSLSLHLLSSMKITLVPGPTFSGILG